MIGLKPKTTIASIIPAEAQIIALNTLTNFAETTDLEYAYQMLLLLAMLEYADDSGIFSIEQTIHYFTKYYEARKRAGLPIEKQYGSKIAVVASFQVKESQIKRMILESPFPRFERRGLLDTSEDRKYFIINPALIGVLTQEIKNQLRSIATRRLEQHFASISL